VETDPALTARILRMVNSAFYGLPHKVASISQGITVLGRDLLRQILIGSVLGGVFGKIDNRMYFMEDFWRQSIKTAILSRYLCRETEYADQAESLFTAGMLHKIGRLIIAQRLQEQALQIQHMVESSGRDLVECEQEVLGFSHCEVGQAFIEKWGLPPLLSYTAKYHSHPEQADQYSDEIRLVHLASQLTFLVAPIDQQEVEFALQDIQDWQKTGLNLAQITKAVYLAEEQTQDVMSSLGMGGMRIVDDD
jgi:HD-like signal output (HDOD) protein